MPVNSNKPDRWKSDVARSVDLYNDWFLEFAPDVYRRTRGETIKQNDLLEARRLAVQNQLDSAKTQAERNKLGQFATPTVLATDMLEHAKSLLPPDLPIRFLDPAIGTGSFHSALLRSFTHSRIADAVGYEIDAHYGHKAIELWSDKALELRIADYTRATPPDSEEGKANLLICNPPYVRHHHLTSDEKLRLRRLTQRIAGIRVLKGNPELIKAVWQALNKISPEILIGEGRVYGGGLYKVEPKELANTPADTILEVLPGSFGKRVEQMALF